MFRRITLGLLAILLTACASAAPQAYRPPAHTGSPWLIEGHLNSMSNGITVWVNKQVVLRGRLSFVQGRAELSGSFDNRPITASCSQNAGFFVRLGFGFPWSVQCIVFVSNERAATLQW